MWQPAPRVGAALGAVVGMMQCVPKGSHHGDSQGGSPRLLSSLGTGLWGCLKCRLAMPSVPRPPALAGGRQHGLAGLRSSLEFAVGSRDDPVLVDQGAAAEVGSRAGLRKKEGGRAGAGQAEPTPKLDIGRGCRGSPWCLPDSQPQCPACHAVPPQCLGHCRCHCPGSGIVPYLQGHLPGP